MFSFQFYTGIITEKKLHINKNELDCAIYDRRLSDNIYVELLFNDKFTNDNNDVLLMKEDQSFYHIKIDDNNINNKLLRTNSYENFFYNQQNVDNLNNMKQQQQLEYTKGPLDGSLYATVLKKSNNIQSSSPLPIFALDELKEEDEEDENNQEYQIIRNQQENEQIKQQQQQQQEQKTNEIYILDDLINEIFSEIQSFPDIENNSNNDNYNESYYDFINTNDNNDLQQQFSPLIIDDKIKQQNNNNDEWLEKQQEKLRTIRLMNYPKKTFVEQKLIDELKTTMNTKTQQQQQQLPQEPPKVPTRTSSRALFFGLTNLINDNDDNNEDDDYGIINKIHNGNNRIYNELTTTTITPTPTIDEIDTNNNNNNNDNDQKNNFDTEINEIPLNSLQFLNELKMNRTESEQLLRSSTPAFPVRKKNQQKLLKNNDNDNDNHNNNMPLFIQDTSSYWYKKNISREEAVRFLLNRPPGSFIIRDSNSFPNSYGLAVRVSNDDIKSDCMDPVRHFLIESTNKGVRIKGCLEEPVFSSLASLVYQHSITKISLPICLLIPSSNDLIIKNYQFNDNDNDNYHLKKFYDNGAACNVLYFLTNDVESLTGNIAIKKTIDILNERKKFIQPAIIHFKASSKGITLTDNSHRLFFRLHYPLKMINFCSIDPDNRSWNYQHQQQQINSEQIQFQSHLFGFVTRKKSLPLENECLIFGHYEYDQPPNAIVDFVNKLLLRSSSSSSSS